MKIFCILIGGIFGEKKKASTSKKQSSVDTEYGRGKKSPILREEKEAAVLSSVPVKDFRRMSMAESTYAANLLGAIVANVNNVLLISIFIARLYRQTRLESVLGIILILTMIPLFYLFISGYRFNRPLLYFIQIGLMLAYLFVELALDYVFKIEFRQIRWMVIPYVMLFFSGTGGMIGVAAQAGRGWTLATIISFLIMGTLAFVQRSITGL